MDLPPQRTTTGGNAGGSRTGSAALVRAAPGNLAGRKRKAAVRAQAAHPVLVIVSRLDAQLAEGWPDHLRGGGDLVPGERGGGAQACSDLRPCLER